VLTVRTQGKHSIVITATIQANSGAIRKTGDSSDTEAPGQAITITSGSVDFYFFGENSRPTAKINISSCGSESGGEARRDACRRPMLALLAWYAQPPEHAPPWLREWTSSAALQRTWKSMASRNCWSGGQTAPPLSIIIVHTDTRDCGSISSLLLLISQLLSDLHHLLCHAVTITATGLTPPPAALPSGSALFLPVYYIYGKFVSNFDGSSSEGDDNTAGNIKQYGLYVTRALGSPNAFTIPK
jgi:hypothetical protein